MTIDALELAVIELAKLCWGHPCGSNKARAAERNAVIAHDKEVAAEKRTAATKKKNADSGMVTWGAPKKRSYA
jgi:hypothetical protein